jgi:hypothetical protein
MSTPKTLRVIPAPGEPIMRESSVALLELYAVEVGDGIEARGQ